MRIVGIRSDGALYVKLSVGLACLLHRDRISPPCDPPAVERLGPWQRPPAMDPRELQRRADRARVTPLFQLGDRSKYPGGYYPNEQEKGFGSGADIAALAHEGGGSGLGGQQAVEVADQASARKTHDEAVDHLKGLGYKVTDSGEGGRMKNDYSTTLVHPKGHEATVEAQEPSEVRGEKWATVVDVYKSGKSDPDAGRPGVSRAGGHDGPGDADWERDMKAGAKATGGDPDAGKPGVSRSGGHDGPGDPDWERDMKAGAKATGGQDPGAAAVAAKIGALVKSGRMSAADGAANITGIKAEKAKAPAANPIDKLTGGKKFDFKGNPVWQQQGGSGGRAKLDATRADLEKEGFKQTDYKSDANRDRWELEHPDGRRVSVSHTQPNSQSMGAKTISSGISKAKAAAMYQVVYKPKK